VLRVVVALLVTLFFTLLSWFLLERPLMRWSKRLEAKRYGREGAAHVAASGSDRPSTLVTDASNADEGTTTKSPSPGAIEGPPPF
jgi:hypothetical protein